MRFGSSLLDIGSESLCGVWDNGERIPPSQGMVIVNMLLPALASYVFLLDVNFTCSEGVWFGIQHQLTPRFRGPQATC